MAHGITLTLRQIVQRPIFTPARVWSKFHEDQIDMGSEYVGVNQTFHGRSGSSYRAARRNFKRLMRKLGKVTP